MIGDLFTLSDSNVMLKNSVIIMYKNPHKRTRISAIVLHNVTDNAVQVKIYHVTRELSTGAVGTASVQNEILDVNVAAHDTFVFVVPEVGIPLIHENDTIQGWASIDDAISYFLYGYRD